MCFFFVGVCRVLKLVNYIALRPIGRRRCRRREDVLFRCDATDLLIVSYTFECVWRVASDSGFCLSFSLLTSSRWRSRQRAGTRLYFRTTCPRVASLMSQWKGKTPPSVERFIWSNGIWSTVFLSVFFVCPVSKLRCLEESRDENRYSCNPFLCDCMRRGCGSLLLWNFYYYWNRERKSFMNTELVCTTCLEHCSIFVWKETEKLYEMVLYSIVNRICTRLVDQ